MKLEDEVSKFVDLYPLIGLMTNLKRANDDTCLADAGLLRDSIFYSYHFLVYSYWTCDLPNCRVSFKISIGE